MEKDRFSIEKKKKRKENMRNQKSNNIIFELNYKRWEIGNLQLNQNRKYT